MECSLHIDQLPLEVLLLIFKYLTLEELSKSVLLVSKRWNAIGNDPHLWRRIKFSNKGSTEVVAKVLAKCTLLHSIEIGERDDMVPILKEIYNLYYIEGDCRIEDLTIVNCNCDTNFVIEPSDAYVMDFWPSLKSLAMEFLYLKEILIGKNLRSLVFLSIYECPMFSPYNIKMIAENCAQFSCLQFYKNQRIFQEWNEIYHDVFKKHAGLLGFLKIDAEFVTDSTLGLLSSSTRLHSLALVNAVNLSAAGFSAISTMKYLRMLHIGNCDNFDEDAIAKVFSLGNLTILEHFIVRKNGNMTDRCLEIVSKCCPYIHHISINPCPLITDSGVETLLKKCKRLRSLSLIHAVGISGSSLNLIPEQAPFLKTLGLEGSKIDDQIIIDLMSRVPTLNLYTLF